MVPKRGAGPKFRLKFRGRIVIQRGKQFISTERGTVGFLLKFIVKWTVCRAIELQTLNTIKIYFDDRQNWKFASPHSSRSISSWSSMKAQWKSQWKFDGSSIEQFGGVEQRLNKLELWVPTALYNVESTLLIQVNKFEHKKRFDFLSENRRLF